MNLFDEPAQFPEAALDSIYKLYPRKENRKMALKRINEALNRISMGEIDGKPRTIAEAVTFLRAKTEEARQEYAGRDEKWIPHPSTYFHGRRYLRVELQRELPDNLGLCIGILSSYPLMPSAEHIGKDPKSFLPALLAIDKAINDVGAGPLLTAVCRYAYCVMQWPVEDRQFVPSAKRFFDERRFEQSESQWQRRTFNGYEKERSQIKRVLEA